MQSSVMWRKVIVESGCILAEVTEEFADPDNVFSNRYYSSFAAHKQHLVWLALTVTCYISLVSSSVIETDRYPLDFNKPG